MKYSLCLVALLVAVCVADPTYWLSTIPNDYPGNPVAREFQTLTNVPDTSLNVLFGGVTYNQTTFSLNDTWILDTAVPVWKLVDITSAPPARAYAVAGATATEVIVFGGQNEAVPRVFFDDVWRFSLSSLNWTKDSFIVPSVLLARSFHAGVLVGDTLYVFGGFSKALQLVTNDVWAYNITSKSWALRSANGRADAPAARQGHSAVFYNDTTRGPSIIFFGGYNGTGGSSDTWQFVISSASWIQLTKNNDPMGPSPRWGASAIFSISPVPTVTIFGGSFVGGPINPYYNDVWSLSLAGSAWNWTMQLPDGDVEGPWKRGGHSSVISAGSAYTFGGYGLFVGLYNDLWQLLNY